MDRAKEEKREPIQQTYSRALKALKTKQIRCLKIVDSGTTGLKRSNWDALVNQEGSVQKTGDAPGGSYGTGKNAVFNVSDLRTVFYSTRCIERGRTEKLQGKATLMAHPDPKTKGKQLQHIGFFAMPKVKPVMGTAIPDFFRLDGVGAGVFIMGFNPRSEQWVDELVDAAIGSFFYAIHHKKLVVRVKAIGSKPIVINHETLDMLFERQERKSPSYFYYKAIRDEKPVATDSIGKIGRLNVHVLFESNGPRKTAYLNRNGMLISDVGHQQTNPIGPKGSGLWPDFATVVIPHTVKGDQWLRNTENPSHDSMSAGQLFEESDRRDAEKWFKDSRKAITNIVNRKAEIDRYGDQSNLNELAEMFPDEFDPDAPGNRVLQTKASSTVVMANPSGHGTGSISGAENYDGSGADVGAGEGHGSGSGGGSGKGDGNGKGTPPGVSSGANSGGGRARAPRLQRPRLIPTGPSKATIAFTIANPETDVVRVSLIPAGGEWTREDKIDITEAKVISPAGQQVTVDDGVLSLSPKTDERVVMEITTNDDISNMAFRIG